MQPTRHQKPNEHFKRSATRLQKLFHVLYHCGNRVISASVTPFELKSRCGK